MSTAPPEFKSSVPGDPEPQRKFAYREQVLYSSGGQLLERVISLLAMAVVVRLLSRESFGIYGILISTVSLIGILTSWGWPAVYTRYIPQLREEGRFGLITSLIAKGIATRAAVTAVFLFCFLFFFDTIGAFLNLTPYRFFFQLFALGIFAHVMASMLKAILNAHLHQKFIYRVQFLNSSVKNLLFILILVSGLGLSGLLIVETLAQLVLLGLFAYFVWTRLIDRGVLKRLQSIPTRIKKYNAFSYLNDTGTVFLDTSIDMLIIGKYLGMEAVALYSLAALIPQRVRQLMPTAFLREVIEPVTFMQYARDPRDEQLNRVFHYLTKLNYLIWIPFLFAIVFFGRELLVLVFGAKYGETYPYLLGLTLFFCLQMFPIGYVTKAKEKVHIQALSKFFSLYNLVADIVLIQVMGLMGVVVATGSARVLKQFYIYWHTKRHAHVTFPSRPLMKLVLITLLFGLALKALSLVGGISFLWILLAGFFLIPPFGLLVLRWGYFSEWEKNSLERILGSLSGKQGFVKRIFSLAA